MTTTTQVLRRRIATLLSKELEGLADAFADHDLPDGWQRAAAETYRRIQEVDSDQIEDVIEAVLRPDA